MSKSAYLNTLGIPVWRLRRDIPAPLASPLVASDAWERLEAQVRVCEQCVLHSTRTQIVFGVGDRQADLLVVGEAPGYYEDQQGEPFVGKAGQLLNAELKAIGLSRDAVYIANVLKCRPPDNRDPKPEEVRCCTPYLNEQIALLSPKVILALGRFAAHYLLGSNESMRALRARTHTYGDKAIPLIVSYHPAYLLRNPADKAKAWQDLLTVKSLLSTLN